MPVRIKLPIQPSIVSMGRAEGVVSARSRFGSQGASITQASASILGMTEQDAYLGVVGKGATFATNEIDLRYGPVTDASRSVFINLWYVSNGVSN
jgi:hypothetical protein